MFALLSQAHSKKLQPTWKQVSAVLMETLEKQIGRVFGDRQIIRGLRPDNRIEAGTEIAIRVSASKREIEIARGFDSDVI